MAEATATEELISSRLAGMDISVFRGEGEAEAGRGPQKSGENLRYIIVTPPSPCADEEQPPEEVYREEDRITRYREMWENRFAGKCGSFEDQNLRRKGGRPRRRSRVAAARPWPRRRQGQRRSQPQLPLQTHQGKLPDPHPTGSISTADRPIARDRDRRPDNHRVPAQSEEQDGPQRRRAAGLGDVQLPADLPRHIRGPLKHPLQTLHDRARLRAPGPLGRGHRRRRPGRRRGVAGGSSGRVVARVTTVKGGEVLLLDSLDGKMPINPSTGAVELSRRVVSVDLRGGKLVMSVVASSQTGGKEDEGDDGADGVVVRGEVIFVPKRDGMSNGTCDLGLCKVEVTVAWSLVSTLLSEWRAAAKLRAKEKP